MGVVQINGLDYNLHDIEKDCWLQLLNGSIKYKDPFHNPVVGNIGEKGVHLRTVVLRKVNTEKKQLAFHTDIRSGKWNELNSNNKVSWLFYSAAGRVQIRISATATLHSIDAIANEAWANSTMSSRKVYAGEIGPSNIVDEPCSGLSDYLNAKDPTPEESEEGRKNFGIVICQANWMEWLWLNSKGHRRASFNYDELNNIQANWLIP